MASSMSRTRRVPADVRIGKMRDYEDTKREQSELIRYYRRADQVSEWERTTDSKIKNNYIRQRFQTLRKSAEEKLDERRLRLRELLQAEELQLQAELRTIELTPEERRAQLETRARELKLKREAERQKFAEEQLRRHWKESCDAVRLMESKHNTVMVAEKRKEQVGEKQIRLAQEVERERALHEMMEQERLKLEERYLRDIEKRKALDAEAVTILDQQLELVKEMKAERAAIIEREVVEMKARWAKEEEIFQKQEEEIRQRNKRIALDLVEYNREQKIRQAQLEEEDRRLERYLVQLSNRKEREEEQRERQLKDRQREEARMYRQHLLLMMQREQESEKERDAMVKAAQDKEWEKREALWRRDMEARARLLEVVHDTRQAQLQEKENRRQAEEEEKRQELERMVREMELMRMDEEREIHEIAMNKKNLFEEIEAQVRHRQAIELVKRQQEQRESAESKAKDEQYERTVKDYKITSPPPNRFNRKTTQWYS